MRRQVLGKVVPAQGPKMGKRFDGVAEEGRGTVLAGENLISRQIMTDAGA